MKTKVLQESIDELMADPQLVELCELQRTGDEVLDVISLTENQHSDILAWMFDTREGHGQGDEILRDLLIHASIQATNEYSELDRRYSTAKFFAYWTPSRIRTASFGGAFTARELGLSASERVDLFVIDAQNKFVLLIENKAGAVHNENQLNLYRENFSKVAAANPVLRDYAQVYIALDRKYDGDDSTSRPCANTWLHLGYEWLQTSAKRALMHVQRGNSAARLVVSYCNRQTEWESPSNAASLKIAANLHRTYPEAMRFLSNLTPKRTERVWLENRKEDLNLLFLLQNKSAVALLRETKGMASVKAAILETAPTLSAENVFLKRIRLNVCPPGWERFETDGWWPVFMNVRYTDAERTKFSLSLCWNGLNASSLEEADVLRKQLALVDPRFSTRIDSSWRRVYIEQGMTLSQLLKLISEMNGKLMAALPPH
ncbi:PD-(D/E)XK nuclease family protein [Herbaspirillum sp.]|uniref:PDDEXK-like family protein n=1 Tax=Herbaspirillum sp. TaxID=1890675 RepID=UPI00257E149F|nr:PD-(D/E)XK nuclease family protein [Herbaspirillum sp.]|tara:strand:- start:109 stop:1401 length:1293 start_codon:yes stop_codon:yes gene_type:complete